MITSISSPSHILLLTLMALLSVIPGCDARFSNYITAPESSHQPPVCHPYELTPREPQRLSCFVEAARIHSFAKPAAATPARKQSR